MSKRYLPSQYLLTIPQASCSLKTLHTAQAALWLNCCMNHLGTSGKGVEGTHPAQFSPPGSCLLSVQAATLDECIASDAANASAVAEKHLTAMRQQAAEAEHAVIALEMAVAEMQALAPAMANAGRPR